MRKKWRKGILALTVLGLLFFAIRVFIFEEMW